MAATITQLMIEWYESTTNLSDFEILNSILLIQLQVREGLDVHEVPDFMRGLGFFPTDYEIECLLHEVEICGKRKVGFEDLVKLYINHSHSSLSGTQKASFESSLKALLNLPADIPPTNINITKQQFASILTTEAERIDEKDAEKYLKELFGKFDEISLENLSMQSRFNVSCCFS